MTKIVFVIDPKKPVTASAAGLGIFTFLNKIHSHPAATPIKIRHPTEIQIDFAAPEIPAIPILIKGENANDKNVGAMVLLIREQIPKTPPRIAPAKGPSKIAPKITGMCTVVAFISGR